jgi:hypothetical protein
MLYFSFRRPKILWCFCDSLKFCSSFQWKDPPILHLLIFYPWDPLVWFGISELRFPRCLSGTATILEIVIKRCPDYSLNSGCVTRDQSDCTCGISHPGVWTHHISSIRKKKKERKMGIMVEEKFIWPTGSLYTTHFLLQYIKFRLLWPNFISKTWIFIFTPQKKLHYQCMKSILSSLKEMI